MRYSAPFGTNGVEFSDAATAALNPAKTADDEIRGLGLLTAYASVTAINDALGAGSPESLSWTGLNRFLSPVPPAPLRNDISAPSPSHITGSPSPMSPGVTSLNPGYRGTNGCQFVCTADPDPIQLTLYQGKLYKGAPGLSDPVSSLHPLPPHAHVTITDNTVVPPQGLSALISQDGASLIARDGMGFVTIDARGQLIGLDGAGLTSEAFAQLVSQTGAGVLSSDGAGVVATGSGNLLNLGSPVVADGGGGN